MLEPEAGLAPIYLHEDPQATVHMVVGTGGAQFTVNYVEPYPDWNEMVFYRYGYARVTAVNASYLDWEWVSSEDRVVYDKMVITQSDPTKPWNLDGDNDVGNDDNTPPVDDAAPADDDDGSSNENANSNGDSEWQSYSKVEQSFLIIASVLGFLCILIALYIVANKFNLFKKSAEEFRTSEINVLHKKEFLNSA